MISDHDVDAAEKARWNTLIAAQMKVLNDSYSGAHGGRRADTPFRFQLTETKFVKRRLVPRRAGQGRARHEEGAVRG